jgi:polyisoprenoid-binding protein YceI
MQSWEAHGDRRERGVRQGTAMRGRRPFQILPTHLAQAGWGLAAFVALVGLCCAGTRAATPVQAWRIDEAHTSIVFKIEAVGFPTTHGRFNHYSGQILIDFAHPAKSYTSFTVDSSSVDVGSQPFNDFVKSAALLDVANHPTLSFDSTQVEKLDPRTARVTGNLMMLGVSRPITLMVNVDSDPAAKGRAVAFQAKGTVTRSEFGMKFGIPLIDDALEFTVKTRALTDE